MSWEWMRTWWRVFGSEDIALRIVVCRVAGETVGLAPLVIVKESRWPLRPRRMRIMRLLGTGEPDTDSVVTEYADLLIAPGHEATVAEALASWLCGAAAQTWDVLACEWLLSGSHITERLVPALHRLGRTHRVRSPGVRFRSRLLPDWDQYLQSLGRNFRTKLTVGRRRMDRDGRFEVLTFDSPSGIGAALERLAVLHRRRWSEKGHAGSFESARFREFHRLLAAQAAAQRGASVTILRLNEQDIAAVYSLHCADTTYSYQTGFDPALAANYSPGMVATGIDIERAIGAGHGYYDFMCSPAGSYKERYGCETTEMFDAYVFNRTLRGYSSRLLWEVAAKVAHLRHRTEPRVEAESD